MSSIFISVTIALVILYCILNYFKTNKYKLPPGPISLPLFGYLPFVGSHPQITFKQLSLKYGNIFSLRLGTTPIVILNDYQSVKEAFNNPLILDRQIGIFDFHPGGFGFSGLNGPEWVEQRRNSMRFIKEYALKSVKWQEDVAVELDEFIRLVAGYDGKPVDVGNNLMLSVSNNMLSLAIGRRVAIGNVQTSIVSEAVHAMSNVFNPARLSSIFPRLAIFLAKIRIPSYADDYIKMYNLNALLRGEVESRQKTSDCQTEIFMDKYLEKMNQMKENNIISAFNESNLVGNMQNLIHAGSETTKTSLEWLFLAMAAFPEIQKKIHKEIDQVLGPDGKCDFSERNKLPYTYATILECQRWITVAPLGLAHVVRATTTIGEFTIPKGTFVISNIWALHNDPNYWNEPEMFQPKRFLLEDGSLDTKEPESYAPFSLGRRNCPGKKIAQVELFIYFQAVLQKFHILPMDDQPPNFLGVSGVTYFPRPQKLRFKPRK